MKNKYPKLLLVFFVICCSYSCDSKDDDNDIPLGIDNPTSSSGFSVNINVGVQELNLDEQTSVTISSEQLIEKFEYSFDDFQTTVERGHNGTSETFCISFDNPGLNTLDLRIYPVEGTAVENSIDFQINSENAVQITNIEINSFFDINDTWDPEFPDDNIDRLADVYFELSKLSCRLAEPQYNLWYESSVTENQENLNWDLSSENVFVDIDGEFFIPLFDKDSEDGSADQSLISIPQLTPFIDLQDYNVDRPSLIVLENNTEQYNIEVTLSWPE